MQFPSTRVLKIGGIALAIFVVLASAGVHYSSKTAFACPVTKCESIKRNNAHPLMPRMQRATTSDVPNAIFPRAILSGCWEPKAGWASKTFGCIPCIPTNPCNVPKCSLLRAVSPTMPIAANAMQTLPKTPRETRRFRKKAALPTTTTWAKTAKPAVAVSAVITTSRICPALMHVSP